MLEDLQRLRSHMSVRMRPIFACCAGGTRYVRLQFAVNFRNAGLPLQLPPSSAEACSPHCALLYDFILGMHLATQD